MSIGEIFDRALTVYLKRWQPFSLLAALTMLPDTVFQFYKYLVVRATDFPTSAGAPVPSLSWQLVWTIMGGEVRHQNFNYFWLTEGSFLVIVTFTNAAFIAGFLAVVRGEPVSAGSWLSQWLGKASRLLGISLVWIIVLAAFLASVGLLSVSITAGAALLHTRQLDGVAIALLLILLLVYALVGAPFAFSPFIATLEDVPAVKSVRSAIARTLGRRFWRTVAINLGLALLAYSLFYAEDALGALLFYWSRSPELATALHAVLRLPVFAFNALVMCAYYYDTRLRESMTPAQQ